VANCMKFIDLGDGVTIICNREFAHDGPCGISRPQHARCCDHRRQSDEAGCIRVALHDGPHKFGDERAAP